MKTKGMSQHYYCWENEGKCASWDTLSRAEMTKVRELRHVKSRRNDKSARVKEC